MKWDANHALHWNWLATARKIGATEIAIYAQFLPPGEAARDLIARMEELWRIAKQA